MKAILIRVGIDSTYGALSPVWNDMSYIYFPIYNKNIKEIEKGENRTYRDLFSNDQLKYLPENLHDKIIHYDPEFETFTYGDVRNKSKILSKLAKGDLLVFYIGGVIQNLTKEKGCFIIGYFDVSEVYTWNGELTTKQKRYIKEKYPNNAHSISSKTQTNLTIIKGNNSSKRLDRCIKLTELNKNTNNPLYITKPGITRDCGIRSFITRAVPIQITERRNLKNLMKLIGM